MGGKHTINEEELCIGGAIEEVFPGSNKARTKIEARRGEAHLHSKKAIARSLPSIRKPMGGRERVQG